MIEDLKFPIKYAVLELKRNDGYSTGYEDITVGFIASKCFVLESTLKYSKNQDPRISHLVTFPFNNIKSFVNSLREGYNFRENIILPSLDACDDYYPATLVLELFDSYEEAKIQATNKNKALENRVGLYLPLRDLNFDELYKKEMNKFRQTMQDCQDYENWITENSKDMKINEDESLKLLRLLEKGQ